MWNVVLSKQAYKDLEKITRSGLSEKVKKLTDVLELNPYQNIPEYEKLNGFRIKTHSRRINVQHRLVYKLYDKEKTVKILRMWTHYE